MYKLIPVLLIVFTSFFFGTNVFAQNKEGANWLFGGNIHADFNSEKPAIDTFSFMAVDSMLKGVAAISDKNGKLLFFTSKGYAVSRQKVNGVYQAMPNGAFYPGAFAKSTMSEMIVQSPADSNIYYLFFVGYEVVNNVIHSDLYYLQVDMRLNNGFGNVVSNSLQLLRKKVSNYKLTALLHANNRDTWVGCANAAGDSIYTYLVTPGGIIPPVISKPPNRLQHISRLKASPNSEMFAVGSNLGFGVEGVDIFDFNRVTGVASHKYSLTSPVFDYPFFSYAFSPNNAMLYAGNIGYEGFPKSAGVFQFDLTAGNNAQVQNSRNMIYNTASSYGVYDMQLAIDGKIYLIIDSTYLSRLNCPDLYGAASRFQAQSLKLPGRVNGGSLPTLNQTIFRNAGKLQAQAFRSTICAGDTVQLTAYGAGVEQFNWELANGLSLSSVALANPIVNPTVTTTYKVTGSSVCSLDTAFVTVTVLPKIPGVTVAGTLQVATLTEHEYSAQNPASGSTFNWQVVGGTIESGQGTGSINVNWGAAGQGEVSVTEIPEIGCNGETVILKIKIAEGPEPVIYNIFTPDNDGRNDAFVIENLKWYAENELKIYNRWGVEVYKTSNYLNTWKAENVSAGVYYYLFTAKGKSWKGWVEVVK